MTTLVALMMVITTILIGVIVPRLYYDWLNFKVYESEKDRESLEELLCRENEWVWRHFGCAVFAIVMVILLSHSSGTVQQLSNVTATYAMISLLFSLVELIFAQKITNALTTFSAVKNRKP